MLIFQGMRAHMVPVVGGIHGRCQGHPWQVPLVIISAETGLGAPPRDPEAAPVVVRDQSVHYYPSLDKFRSDPGLCSRV